MPIKISTSLFVVITAACLLSLSTVVWASFADPQHVPMPISDEEPDDDEAEFPEPVVLEDYSITRGDGSEPSIGSSYGGLTLDVEGYESHYVIFHDRAEEDVDVVEYGLRLEVEGEHPEGLELPEEPVVLRYPYDNIWINWVDSDTSDEPIDVNVTATWVDEYGREGPTSDPIHVTDDGLSSIPGCS